MSARVRIGLVAAAAIWGLLTSSLAAAVAPASLWKGAEPGMSVAQVHAIFPASYVQSAPDGFIVSPSVRNLLDVRDALPGGLPAVAEFFFLPGKGLVAVVVTSRGQQIDRSHVDTVSAWLTRTVSPPSHCSPPGLFYWGCNWQNKSLVVTASSMLRGSPILTVNFTTPDFFNRTVLPALHGRS